MEYIDSNNDGFLSFKEYKGKPFSFEFVFHVRSDLTYKFTERVYDKFEIMLISSRTVYFHVGKTADTGNADEHSAKESFKRLDKDSDGKLNKVCIAYKGYFNFELFRKPTNSGLRIFGLVKICSSVLKSFSGGLY